MTEVVLLLELAEGNDPEPVMDTLRSGLNEAEEVARSEVLKENKRIAVAEVVALIAVSVALIDQGTSALESARKFVKTARELIEEINGLKNVIMEIGSSRIDLLNASEEEIACALEGNT